MSVNYTSFCFFLLLRLSLQIAENCCLLYACIFYAWEHFKCPITLNHTPYHQHDGILPSQIKRNDASFFWMLCLCKLNAFFIFWLILTLNLCVLFIDSRIIHHLAVSILRWFICLSFCFIFSTYSISLCFIFTFVIHQYLFNYSSIIVIRHRKKTFPRKSAKNKNVFREQHDWVSEIGGDKKFWIISKLISRFTKKRLVLMYFLILFL